MDYTGNLPCDIADVVELLGIRVVRNTGTQLHCKCPFCDDRKAHLNINLGKNVFRCNRCGKGGGVLHLYRYIGCYPHRMELTSSCKLDRDRSLYGHNSQRQRLWRLSPLYRLA